MNSNQHCFCGSKRLYTNCCQPLISKIKQAKSPEQLMRSRFSAYAIKAYQYIYDTYSKQSQASQTVTDIKDSSANCHWFALSIYPIENISLANADLEEQFVEFSAFYISDDKVCELREKSRFVLEDFVLNDNNAHISDNRQWRYIDGDIKKHCELENITRNQLCPCNNYPSTWTNKKGKKYKHCCGKY